MDVYTIGFTKKTAEVFFEALASAGIRNLIDIRLNNTSQLAGFAKASDLPYLLEKICGIQYSHEPLLAPTREILDDYKKNKSDWENFERRFMDLMAERGIENELDKNIFKEPAVLMCSEHIADQCHRRLVAEYLNEKWGGINIVHL